MCVCVYKYYTLVAARNESFKIKPVAERKVEDRFDFLHAHFRFPKVDYSYMLTHRGRV